MLDLAQSFHPLWKSKAVSSVPREMQAIRSSTATCGAGGARLSSPSPQDKRSPTVSASTLGAKPYSEVKEILISLPGTAAFYIKHIQSVKGRERQSSLVGRTLLQETVRARYGCCSHTSLSSSHWEKKCPQKKMKASNAEKQTVQ